MAERIFLALDLDDSIRDRLRQAQQQFEKGWASVKWVEGALLHVTLKFLGDLPEELLADVCDVVCRAASRREPFDFHVSGVVCVPPRGRLRMIWADVEDPVGSMAILHKDIDAALGDMPVKQENRSFKPHITLGRIRHAAQPAKLRLAAETLAHEDFGWQSAEEVVVYTSELTPRGPVHTPVARGRLGRSTP